MTHKGCPWHPDDQMQPLTTILASDGATCVSCPDCGAVGPFSDAGDAGAWEAWDERPEAAHTSATEQHGDARAAAEKWVLSIIADADDKTRGGFQAAVASLTDLLLAQRQLARPSLGAAANGEPQSANYSEEQHRRYFRETTQPRPEPAPSSAEQEIAEIEKRWDGSYGRSDSTTARDGRRLIAIARAAIRHAGRGVARGGGVVRFIVRLLLICFIVVVCLPGFARIIFDGMLFWSAKVGQPLPYIDAFAPYDSTTWRPAGWDD